MSRIDWNKSILFLISIPGLVVGWIGGLIMFVATISWAAILEGYYLWIPEKREGTNE